MIAGRTEEEERAAVVAEAQSWVGTPYHHMAAIKGHGCDCGQLIKYAFVNSEVIDPFQIGKYTRDWHLHRSEERYLEQVETYLNQVSDGDDRLDDRISQAGFEVKPGDVIVFRIGRTFSHGCLVTKWPMVVHASFPSGCVEEVSVLNTPMSRRPSRVYSYWSPTR